jgi:RimJ/RimL family protein N-acetyltransferase
VRYLYEEPLSREESRVHLERRLNTGPADPGEWRNFAVDLGGVLIGEVGVVVNSDLHRSAEVGYFFDPEFAGRGFATSAVAVMVEWCFRERGAHRVTGRLDGRNVASARLLERLGFTFEGRFRENEFVKGEWTDEVVYAVLDRDWEASRSTRSQLIPIVFHVKQ